ncbi:MAG: cytochrome c oxidase assembly protein [Solirubrobacteraceae bacterium]
MSAPSPLQVLDTWTLDPGLTLALASSAAVYVAGARRARRRSGSRWPLRRTGAFLCGLAAVAVALESGLDGDAELMLSLHMIQHLVLVLVAAPLLLAGAPLTLALRALPPAPRKELAGVLRGRPLRALSHPAVGLSAIGASMLLTHLTPLYGLALEDRLVHAGEHVLFLASGLLFWSVLIAAGPPVGRLDGFGRIVYLMLGMPLMSVVGVILETDATPRYHQYVAPARALHVSALSDQRLAGALMWVAGTLVMGTVALGAAWQSLALEERRAKAREAYADAAGALRGADPGTVAR